MNSFSATNESEADVLAPRADIWAVLTDPVLLAKLTPLLRSIDAHDDLWHWNMTRIAGLGIGISPSFTERMQLDPMRRIDYTHAPPEGVTERTGAEGWYELTEVEGGTHLAISLTLRVELPLPKAAKPAVTRIIRTTMQRTGDQLSANMLRHLGVDAPKRSFRSVSR